MTVEWVEIGPDCRIACADSLDVLPTLADGSVDAVVTDPPYNVGLDYDGITDDRSDYAAWCAGWLAELKRICRGPILISCGITNLGLWHGIEKPKWVLCWWKPAAMGRSAVGFNNWEPVLLYGKSRGKDSCDVFEACIKPDRAIDWHPCPKPVEWAAKQIKIATTRGQTVLDPFAGSGSALVASMRLGRVGIGIEQSRKYFGGIRRRLEACHGKGSLFEQVMEASP